MELTKYVDELQRQLATAAAAGGDEARELADRLTAPLDAAVRLVLLEALSDAAAEITAELAPGAVDVRLRGRDPELVVTPAPTSVFEDAAPVTVEPARPAALDPDDVSTTRTTLRLPDLLKAQVEDAAAREGVSVNTWLVRAVAAALTPAAPPRVTTTRAPSATGRVTGWVR
ncbi:histidine kinase [Oerskovia turbata]